RVIPRPAQARLAQRLQRAGVQALDGLDDEPDQVVLTNPEPHILGQHHRLIPVYRQGFFAHEQLFFPVKHPGCCCDTPWSDVDGTSTRVCAGQGEGRARSLIVTGIARSSASTSSLYSGTMSVST